MHLLNQVQKELSVLQAIPVIGPIVSLPKAALSTAQMVAGFCIGISFGMMATSSAIIGEDFLAETFGSASLKGFKESILGFGSLFYACVNLGTFGLAGMFVELDKRNVYHITTHRTPYYYHRPIDLGNP